MINLQYRFKLLIVGIAFTKHRFLLLNLENGNFEQEISGLFRESWSCLLNVRIHNTQQWSSIEDRAAYVIVSRNKHSVSIERHLWYRSIEFFKSIHDSSNDLSTIRETVTRSFSSSRGKPNDTNKRNVASLFERGHFTETQRFWFYAEPYWNCFLKDWKYSIASRIRCCVTCKNDRWKSYRKIDGAARIASGVGRTREQINFTKRPGNDKREKFTRGLVIEDLARPVEIFFIPEPRVYMIFMQQRRHLLLGMLALPATPMKTVARGTVASKYGSIDRILSRGKFVVGSFVFATRLFLPCPGIYISSRRRIVLI